jgi:hypothetical protein
MTLANVRALIPNEVQATQVVSGSLLNSGSALPSRGPE